MAKVKVSKSQKIRDHLATMPRARPKEIVAALSKEGVAVSAALVSQVKSNRRKKNRKAVAKPASATSPRQDALGINDLRGAKKLVDQLGGLKQARKALDVLEELT